MSPLSVATERSFANETKTCLNIQFIYRPISSISHHCVCFCQYLALCLSVSQANCLSLSLPVCLSLYLLVFLFIYICLFTCLSERLPISIPLSVGLTRLPVCHPCLLVTQNEVKLGVDVWWSRERIPDAWPLHSGWTASCQSARSLFFCCVCQRWMTSALICVEAIVRRWFTGLMTLPVPSKAVTVARYGQIISLLSLDRGRSSKSKQIIFERASIERQRAELCWVASRVLDFLPVGSKSSPWNNGENSNSNNKPLSL